MSKPLLIVSHGLISNQDGLILHPDLFLWQDYLTKCKQQWFHFDSRNPLAMYAALLGVEPSLLLASSLSSKTSLNQIKQYWVASPYHAKLTRDSVRVMPEDMLPWCAEDATWACDVLNPLLQEEGMHLEAVDAALLLCCEKPLSASPAVFAEIAGNRLPNRHPAGKDGGHLMRLMSEIQMLFKQSPALHRQKRGDLDVHGLWLWGSSEARDFEPLKATAVATRNSFLSAVVDGKDANVIITEPEKLPELIKQGSTLPKQVLLLADDHAVLLKKAILPNLFNKGWLPRAVKKESELISLLRDKFVDDNVEKNGEKR